MQSNNEIAHQLASSSSRCTMCTTSGTKDLQGIEAPSADTKCEFACFCRKCCVFVVMVEPFVKKKRCKNIYIFPHSRQLGFGRSSSLQGFPSMLFLDRVKRLTSVNLLECQHISATKFGAMQPQSVFLFLITFEKIMCRQSVLAHVIFCLKVCHTS